MKWPMHDHTANESDFLMGFPFTVGWSLSSEILILRSDGDSYSVYFQTHIFAAPNKKIKNKMNYLKMIGIYKWLPTRAFWCTMEKNGGNATRILPQTNPREIFSGYVLRRETKKDFLGIISIEIA